MAMGICDGRVALVTGAGRGIGRGHALEFARQGAKVVVNDFGMERDGSGEQQPVAQQVVDEIKAMGGEAVAHAGDVSDWNTAKEMVDLAYDTFGDLHALVNNAGILRDRMLFNMEESEWDSVVQVHLKGTFCPTRHAVARWREEAKAGAELDKRVINTTSTSGIFANPGQSNYGAAKSGIATLTIIGAKELQKYGITMNAIAPGALTRMTADLGGGFAQDAPEGEWNPRDPDNIAPIVVWLGSPESKDVSGQVFTVSGGSVGVATGWAPGPRKTKDGRWDPAELGPLVSEMLQDVPDPLARPGGGGRRRAQAKAGS
jgi:NAD(P)-dependent dehydrogenase (short-subunit alcohol dehydrogenase family)